MKNNLIVYFIIHNVLESFFSVFQYFNVSVFNTYFPYQVILAISVNI